MCPVVSPMRHLQNSISSKHFCGAGSLKISFVNIIHQVMDGNVVAILPDGIAEHHESEDVSAVSREEQVDSEGDSLEDESLRAAIQVFVHALDRGNSLLQVNEVGEDAIRIRSKRDWSIVVNKRFNSWCILAALHIDTELRFGFVKVVKQLALIVQHRNSFVIVNAQGIRVRIAHNGIVNELDNVRASRQAIIAKLTRRQTVIVSMRAA